MTSWGNVQRLARISDVMGSVRRQGGIDQVVVKKEPYWKSLFNKLTLDLLENNMWTTVALEK